MAGLMIICFMPVGSVFKRWGPIVIMTCYWITYFIVWCGQAKKKEKMNSSGFTFGEK